MAEAGGSRRMAETDGGSRALPGGQLTGRLGVHLDVHLIKRGGPRGYSVKRRGRRVWDDEGGGPGTSGPGTARVVGPGGLGCQTRTGMVLVSLGAGGWGRIGVLLLEFLALGFFTPTPPPPREPSGVVLADLVHYGMQGRTPELTKTRRAWMSRQAPTKEICRAGCSVQEGQRTSGI